MDAISQPDKTNPLPPKEEKNKTKGDMFEKYVENLFDKKYYVTEEWTSDIYNKRNGSYVESNKNPDLIIRYIPSGDRFAVECKYRSHVTNSKIFNTTCIQWSHPDQIQRYNEFQSSKHIPVFIVIGVGNDIIKDEPPKLMFCIPLKLAKAWEKTSYDQFKEAPENITVRTFFKNFDQYLYGKLNAPSTNTTEDIVMCDTQVSPKIKEADIITKCNCMKSGKEYRIIKGIVEEKNHNYRKQEEKRKVGSQTRI